ncbi:putative inorganic phosphate cotransporter isoform X2 [Macrosteles quadrilineatus]|uniref:putative inorganic phosphate cotransporter isoform X2 n=1 Tax=Macrosteles quadrilineatus TaxID=74068 RepID=UPI0023E2AD6C|nr:putative inorganic phosphate cotransporter isoform X2 [Macrosteles quadrilineatus]
MQRLKRFFKRKYTGFGTRHCQACMLFLGMIFAYSMRVNLSVGIVAMTAKKSSNTGFPILPWDNALQGIILGSFFWGYMMTQIPAGQLARRFGPKYLLAGAMLLCSVSTILSPYIATNYSWVFFCFTRVLQGLSQGFLYPSINTHMAKWAPPLERSRIFSFVFGGTQFGTVVTLFVAGYLAAGPYGWPSIFYVTGLCSGLWAIAWLFVGADCPDSHISISEEERIYIKSTLVSNSDKSSALPTPWKDIVTSVPMWALLIAHLGQNWGFWMLLTMMPSYMSHVLGFDIKSNGLISSLPYMMMWALTLIFSWVADYINEKRILSLSVSRKMWNTIAHWGGAIALLGLSFISSVFGAVALLTVSVALNAGVYMGFLTNHLDLSPNFAGLLMGITNGLANVTSILGPMITGFIVSDETSKEQWLIAFYLAALVFFIGNLVFIIFGSTEVQPWNEPKQDQAKHEKQIV